MNTVKRMGSKVLSKPFCTNENLNKANQPVMNLNTCERHKLLVTSSFVTSSPRAFQKRLLAFILLAMGIVTSGLLQNAFAKTQPRYATTTAMEWGIAAYQQGNDELALSYFAQAWFPQTQLVGLKPVDPTPLVWQAKCYARLGQRDQSAIVLNEATALAQPGSQAYAFATKALQELFPPNTTTTEPTSLSPSFRQTLGEPSKFPSERGSPLYQWQQPIVVWVQPNMPASLSNKQAQRLQVSSQEIEHLLRQWQPALPNGIPMGVTQDATQANVRIEWVERIESPSAAVGTFTSGLTQWKVENHQLIGATVRIAVKGPSGQPRTKVALLQTTLHELGHALGLAQHSTQAGDIMAAHGVGSYHVSSNDLARLQALYSSPESTSTSTTLTVLP